MRHSRAADSLSTGPDLRPATLERTSPMKPHRRNLLAAGLIAAAGFGAAIAQTPPSGAASGPGRDPARMEQFRARMEQRMAQRLGEVKQKLAITPAQEGAWN